MVIGFKVVKLIEDRYYSVFVDVPNRVEYILNTAASPPAGCGDLTVFSKKTYAEAWMDDLEAADDDINLALFKCNYTPTGNVQLFTPTIDPTTGFSRTEDISLCPTGTALASSVTLTKRITR